MNKKLILFILLVVIIILPNLVSAQGEFDNGEFSVGVSEYGRTRLYLPPNTDSQLQRFSFIAGTGSDAVFDYTVDADNVAGPTDMTTPPYSANWGCTAIIDNAYSLLPPDVQVTQRYYCWDAGSFVLVNYTV